MENFEVTSTLSSDELKQAKTIMRIQISIGIRIAETVVLALLIANYIHAFIVDNTYTTAISMVGICITILALVWLVPYISSKVNDDYEPQQSTYTFCDEHIIFGGSEVEYTQIEKVVKTPTLLIMMFDERHMTAISKASVGDEVFEKISALLKQKKGRSFKVKKR